MSSDLHLSSGSFNSRVDVADASQMDGQMLREKEKEVDLTQIPKAIKQEKMNESS